MHIFDVKMDFNAICHEIVWRGACRGHTVITCQNIGLS
jgi:hypothetical protein